MKKFVKKSIVSLFVILSIIAITNFYVDPFWCFNHTNEYNQHQKGVNERQQKTNKIYFTNKDYNAVLLGSSRITYFNQNKLNGKVYNYASSDLQPKEYKIFLDFLKNNTSNTIDTVYIGLDFYGSLTYGKYKFNNSASYGNLAISDFYRYKLLFSIDSLNTSSHNVKSYFRDSFDRYNRDNIKTPKRQFGSTTNETIFNVANFVRYKYKDGKRDLGFKKHLLTLKQGYPNIKFKIFTTPVSKSLINEIITKNMYSNYEQWIIDIVDVFGELDHFMFINNVSKQNKYFMDSNHAYPRYYNKIAEILNADNKNADFVIKINNNNLHKKLKMMHSVNNL